MTVASVIIHQPAPVVQSASPDAGVDVSVLTPLLPMTALRTLVQGLLLVVENQGADPVTFYLDTSEYGTRVDMGSRVTIDCPAGEERSYEITNTLREYYALSAETAAPYPVARVRWKLLVIPRRGFWHR